MSALSYLANRPDEVLADLRQGQITALETANEQLPDFFLLYAIQSGLLDQLAATFPDPRKSQIEIPLRILLAAGIAGHYAGLYALSASPYALHSPTLLSALGVQIGVNLPGHGLSKRGTHQETPFHGDVVRKLLAQVAKHDRQDKRLCGQSLLDWYNTHVGSLFCQAVHAQPTLHMLDCTHLLVTLHNDHYELSGVTTQDGEPQRGYKLGTLRSLLDEGAVITGIAWGAIEQHDLSVTADLVRTSVHLRPGDTLLEDRGFLDGATITHLKKERGVEVITGLKTDMNLFKAAVVAANAHPGSWQPHPTRPHQQMQLVTGLSSLWPTLGVPMNGVIVRSRHHPSDPWRYFGFATTDLSLSGRWVILHSQVRPEIEEDYRQLKSSRWQIDTFCTTRLVQILWHVILTLLAYNLFQIFANTKAGRHFAFTTKQQFERKLGRNPPTHLLVCTRSAYAVYETKSLLYVLLNLPEDVRQKVRQLLPKQLE